MMDGVNNAQQPNREQAVDFGFLPIPTYLHYAPQKAERFDLTRNIIFCIATTFGWFYP